jgi:hypothetical protein
VPDEHGKAVVYVISEPASHYYHYVVALVMWQLPAFFRGSQAVASADTT